MTCKPPRRVRCCSVAVDRNLDQFMCHFNRGEYFEAHENLEALWIVCGRGNNPLRGLIQLCAALEQRRRGKPDGAKSLFQKAAVLLRTGPAGANLNLFVEEVGAILTSSLSPDDPPAITAGAVAELTSLVKAISLSRKGSV